MQILTTCESLRRGVEFSPSRRDSQEPAAGLMFPLDSNLHFAGPSLGQRRKLTRLLGLEQTMAQLGRVTIIHR